MNKELICKITDRVIGGSDTGNWNMDIDRFDWCPGVGLYGIFTAYKATEKKEYLDFLINWADRHLEEAYNQKTVNSTCPMLTITELYNITGNEKYLKVCNDMAEWVITEAPLTREGGLEHTVTENANFSEQIWADTLFMVCLFLIKHGKYTNQPKYVDFSINQFKIHYNLLQDKSVHLCYHGWDCENSNNLSGVFWGRANAWIMFATPLMLDICTEFSGRDELKACFKNHAFALFGVQNSEGMFNTVLTEKDSYIEVSASAGIACGIKMGVNSGYLPAELTDVYEKVMKKFPDYVDQDGSVTNVSSGTAVMPSIAAYNTIPLTTTLYGQCLSILMLSV